MPFGGPRGGELFLVREVPRHCTPGTEVQNVGGARNLRKNAKRFRGVLVFQAHRLVYHSTLVLRVIKKKRSTPGTERQNVGGARNLGTGLYP